MEKISRNEVIQRLCRLASMVGSSQPFRDTLPHDCFCTELQPHDGYQFDAQILAAMELAVAKEFNFEVDLLDEKTGPNPPTKEK